MREVYILSNHHFLHIKTGDTSEDTLLAVIKAIEDPAVTGEMFTSAASYDPLFWPVHGQIERILALKRIRKSQGFHSGSNGDSFVEDWGFAGKDTRYLMVSGLGWENT